MDTTTTVQNFKAGDTVRYAEMSDWRVSSEPAAPGFVILIADGVRVATADEVRELNPGRELVAGETYKQRRSNGAIEDGWAYRQEIGGGYLQFSKRNSVRAEVRVDEVSPA